MLLLLPLCRILFSATLRRHADLLHNKDFKLVCDACGWRFETEVRLSRHQKRVCVKRLSDKRRRTAGVVRKVSSEGSETNKFDQFEEVSMII